MKQKMIDFLNVLQVFNKSLVMLLVLAIGVWFRLKNYLNGDNFVELIKTTVIAYFGAHVSEHFVTMVRDHLASKNAPVATLDGDSVAVEADDTARSK